MQNPRISQLRRLLVDLSSKQLPPAFVFLCDEAWAVERLGKRLLHRALSQSPLESNMDVWAWNLHGLQKGWGVHRDRSTMPLTQDEAACPRYMTMWVPLTDTSPLDGCIYVVPARFDPHYFAPDPTADLNVDDFDVQDVRALPASTGSCLFWSGRLLHFGGRVAPQHGRMSLSFGYSRRDWESTETRLGVHIDLRDTFPTFHQRLHAIAVQLWTYEHREPLTSHVTNLLREYELLAPTPTAEES